MWPVYRSALRRIFREDLGDAEVLLDQAHQFSRDRRYREALVQAEKDINNRKYDKAVSRFASLKSFGQKEDIGVSYWDELSASRWDEDRTGVVRSIYLPTLDRQMGGGLAAGELGIIMGVGKAGKSTLLGQIAAGAMWQGKKAAIATAEFSANQIPKEQLLAAKSCFAAGHGASVRRHI